MPVSTPPPDRLEAASAALDAEETANGLLHRTADELVGLLDAPACLVSRVIGDLLVEITRSSGAKVTPTGHGYLVSSYPLTRDAIDDCRPRTVSLLDESPDPNEAALLRELGFDSLLMLPLPSLGECWGLVEVYANDRRFGEDEAELGERFVARAGDLLGKLPDYRRS